MKSRQKGVALIELALILPLLLLLAIVTTEYGRALYHYNAITKSMRDAVRYLSVQTPGTKLVETRNLVVFGNTTGTGSPLVPGLTVTHVAAPVWQTVSTNPVINTVTVTVTGFTFQPMFASVFGVAFGNVPYSDISATMRAPGS